MTQDGSAPAGRRGSPAFSCVIGALSGAAIAGHWGDWGTAAGAVAGAIALGAMEVVARARQRPARSLRCGRASP